MNSRVRKVIARAVQQDNGCDPKFYVIGGSDIYGFKSEKGSDTDVRGFHLAPNDQFFKISHPKEQIIINQDGLTSGYERFDEIELVSYELRKFGKLICKMNFNVIEWLFKGIVVADGIPMDIDLLRRVVKDALPGPVPYHYLGMAKQNYSKYLVEGKICYKPTAKKFLYVLRGLLAAKRASEGEIEPDITKLDGGKLIGELIKHKRIEENNTLPEELVKESRELILNLFEEIERFENTGQNKGMEKYVDNWMLNVRGIV